MQTRRETLKHSAVVAGLLAAAGYPGFAMAAFNKAGFDAKSVQDATKAFGHCGKRRSGAHGRQHRFGRRQTIVDPG